MAEFYYVTKEETKPIKQKLTELIKEVQDLVGEEFTFQFKFVGSSTRNMITADKKSNTGYDFDVNIYVNKKFEAKEIRNVIKNAIDKVAYKYGYGYAEDSTSVITIKKVNIAYNRIVHSCDFAIVYDCNDGRQKYIRFNKKHNYYSWEYRGEGFVDLEKKVEWLFSRGYKNEVRAHYLYKKNNNRDPYAKSRSVFAQTIKEVCDQKGYKR